jgi:diguanylate cyclase (GGDEF)-like protein/PAS domain S-box-containing protein
VKRNRHGVICISLVIGLAIWIMDAAIDAAFFSKGFSPGKKLFLDLVIWNVPGNRLFFRVLFVATFVFYGVLMSILLSREKEMQDLIVHAKEEWEETFDIINDAITIHDADFNILRANKAAEKMLGVPFQVLLSRKCYLSYHGTDCPPTTCPSCRTLFTGVPSTTETFEASLNKHIEIKALPRYDRNKTLTGVVHVVRDISGRVQAEEQLRSLSLTDELTGLYNRRGFFTLAEQQQKVAHRMKKGSFLLFADVDDLKAINDAFGHQEGCKALVEAATILKESFRESDIIARIGGDEFVVFSIENDLNSNAGTISGRLRQKIESLNAKRSDCYRLSLSTGVAYYSPDNPRPLSDLLNEADASMYAQKRMRKNR